MARKPTLIDDEAPELTDAELGEMRPAREVMTAEEYAAVASVRAHRKTDDQKVSVTIRLNRSVVEAYKSTGKSWREGMSRTLTRSAMSGALTDGKGDRTSTAGRATKTTA